MKIRTLHFCEVGPLRSRRIDFSDDWSGDVGARILLSGPNGSGKSTVLRAVAMLWDAAGQWLDQGTPLRNGSAVRQWLQRCRGVAMVLVDTAAAGEENPEIGLIFGDSDWCDALIKEQGDVQWLGESVARNGKPSVGRETFYFPPALALQNWADARKKMILGFEPTALPNVIFMDAEERRWRAPKRHVGEHLAEQPALRWSPRYLATEDWQGQLEASLINLKVTQPRRFLRVLAELNQFLTAKEIESDIQPGANRLRVKLKGTRGQSHTLDELSAGEHQVLIMLYLIARWAEKGCLVLIDEPDLYLHPSLIGGLLSRIEALVDELGGQLLITSHIPEVWSRFESAGRRIELGGDSEQG